MNYTLDELREIPIFFIVGKGRSGTTLLSTILDSHKNIASATESRFLLLICQRYKNLTVWKPEMADVFFKNLMRDYRVKYLWEFEDDFVDALKKLPEETKVQDLIKMVYIYRKTAFKKEKVQFIFDKNPRYTLFISKLQHIFPDGKFIRIIRDPRDNITSHLKFTAKTAGMLSYKWLKYNEYYDNKAAEKPDDFLTLRFEDLVLDKDTFFERFQKFTGTNSLVDVEEKRISKKDEFEKKFSQRLKNQHQSSFKPLDPKKVGHFREKLTAKQVMDVDAVAFPYAEKFNYKREGQEIPLKIKTLLSYKYNYYFHEYSNYFLYNLPFGVIVNLYDVLLKYIMYRKREKLDKLKEEREQG